MSNRVDIRFINPATMPKPVGYSQVAVVRSGQIVFIAGQVALNPAGNPVGQDNLPRAGRTSIQESESSTERFGVQLS